MGEGFENDLIEHTLIDLKKLPRQFESIKKVWRNGDLTHMEEDILNPWREQFPELYNSLLDERNNNWIPAIEKMLKTDEVELILFGVMRLAGDKGVIAQLDALGYKIVNQ